jgi:hypothetical protein
LQTPVSEKTPAAIKPAPALGPAQSANRSVDVIKRINLALAGVMASTIFMAAANANAAPAVKPEAAAESNQLYQTVAELDTLVFDAFNRCAEPGQLDKHAGFFAPDVEFYHDNGGVTWSRDEMIAGTRNNVCGKFSRELVAGSLKVYPIQGFGAIAQGSHRFCQFASGKCEGLADFTMIWREQQGKWQLTRVLSYGHRPAP